MTPHRCPVCEGHGLVPWPAGVTAGMPFSSTSVGPWPCRPCNGTGVLWEATEGGKLAYAPPKESVSDKRLLEAMGAGSERTGS